MKNTKLTERKTYSTAEAAAQIGISRCTLRRWIHKGKLPAIHIGKDIQIPRGPLDDLLAGKTI